MFELILSVNYIIKMGIGIHVADQIAKNARCVPPP
jgi:hypothetical protein